MVQWSNGPKQKINRRTKCKDAPATQFLTDSDSDIDSFSAQFSQRKRKRKMRRIEVQVQVQDETPVGSPSGSGISKKIQATAKPNKPSNLPLMDSVLVQGNMIENKKLDNKNMKPKNSLKQTRIRPGGRPYLHEISSIIIKDN